MASNAASHSTKPSSTNKLWTVGTLTYTSAGLIALFCWLLWGDFAWSMKDRSILPAIQLLLKKYGASDTFSGILIGALPAAINIILTPIISYKSDYYRSRWGRRIPFILAATPLATLALFGVAFSPSIGTLIHWALGSWSPGMDTSILISIAVCWTVSGIAGTAYSIFLALINDVVPESLLGRFFGMFRALSLIAGMIFNTWLLDKSETRYAEIFVGIGLFYGIGFTLSCFKVKEGEYPPPPVVTTPSHAHGGVFGSIFSYLTDCFGHSYYLCFFATFALMSTAFYPINLFSLYYAKSLGMNMSGYGYCLTLTYLISLIISYPLGVLADRFHPLRVSLIIQVFYGIVSLLGGIFAMTPWTFAIGFIAHGVLSGTWFTASASLGQRLLPKDKFAQFYSAMGIVTCFGALLISPIMGKILDCTDHAYRNTFYVGFLLTAASLAFGWKLHRRFMELGGPKNYIAPE
ncbi:MAG: MFS transporter [Chthoniobacteraceae bacterium]